MSELPRAEELFGPPPSARAGTGTASTTDVFGPPPSERPGRMDGPPWDQYFGDQASQAYGASILEGFGYGFKQGFGAQPLLKGPAQEALKDAGILKDYEEGQNNIVRQFGDFFIRPLAFTLDLALRGPSGIARGLIESGSPLTPLGAVAETALEGGFQVGLPHGPAPTALSVRRGIEHGLTSEQYPGTVPHEAIPPAVEALTPTGRPTPTERVIAPQIELPEVVVTPQATDIHSRVRLDNPELFQHYDSLTERKQVLSDQLEALRQAEAKPFQDEINIILGKVNGVEDRLTNIARERLEAARHNLEFTLGKDSPERQAVRLERAGVDADLREIAPDINTAYRTARDAMPEPPMTVETPPVVTDLPDYDNVVPLRPGEQELQPASIRPNPGGGFDIDTQQAGTLYAKDRVEAERLSQQYGTLTQRRPTIFQTVLDQVSDAGRPLEEARAVAAITDAYYRTRAERFGGALGSARDLFDREHPPFAGGDVFTTARGVERPEVGGAYNIAQNTIGIFKSANAGTAIHELGHNWLEQMLTDAKHPQAPQDLVNDLNAVKGWLQMQGDRPTVKQHEQFARGFERYLMEGVAPTSRLANVFAKFADWLTTLYRTVSRLRAPINDEMRGVFDRLLSNRKDSAIIVPERAAQDLGSMHETELAAAHTPEAALDVAEKMRQERDAVAVLLNPEINNARRRARLEPAPAEPAPTGGETETGGGRTTVPGAPDEGVERISVGAEPAPEPTEIGPSGASFKANSKAPTDSNTPIGARPSRVVNADGTFNIKNIESADDIDEAIRVGSQGGHGPATDADLIGLSDALGTDRFDKDAVVQRFGKAEIEAAGRLLNESATFVRDRMIETAESGDPLELAKAIARHEAIQGWIKQKGSEYGQALRALRTLYEQTGGKTQVLDALLRQETGRSYDQLLQMSLLGQNLQTPAQVSKFIQQTSANKMIRGVAYYYTNSLISGSFTHTAYIVGNEIRNGLQPIETALQASVGSIREAVGMDPKDRVYWQEVWSSFHGLMQGTKDAWRPALDAYYASQQLPLPGEKMFINPWGAYGNMPKSIDLTIGQPGKVVAGIHQFGRVQFYTQELYRLAAREGIREGIEAGWDDDQIRDRITQLQRNPTAELMAAAADRAETNMFQRQSGYGTLQKAAGAFVDAHPMARLFFPFIKIGLEIDRETFMKRTPVGVLMSAEVRNAVLGRMGGAAFDEAAGKQMLGVGLLGAGVGLAASGSMNGYGPTDPKARASWLADHTPYSINVFGMQIPMQGLGPPGKLLQFAADMFETVHYWDGEDGTKLATGFSKAVARAVLEESFFRDMETIFKAIDEPATAGVRFLENWVSGFIPFSSAIYQTNRHVFDPYQKDVEPGFAGFIDSLKARVPVLSEDIPNRLDMFGNELPGRGVEWTARYPNDPIVKWLQDLQTGPGRLPRDIRGVRLTPEQFHDYGRISGRLFREFMENAYNTGLQGLPRQRQITEIGHNLERARRMARQEIMLESAGGANDILEKARTTKEKQLSD